MRSSSEWKVTTTRRPPGLSTCSAATNPAASSASSSLTKMRSAWNVRVAGWMAPGRACTMRATMSAERARGADRRIAAGGDDGAGDGARVAFFAEDRQDGCKVALGGRRHDVGRARSRGAHAHVERTVVAEGKSALGLVELHRGDAEVEDHAVDRVVAAAARHRLQIGEGVLYQHEPPLRRLHKIGAARDRALVAVDAQRRCSSPRRGFHGCSRRRRTWRPHRRPPERTSRNSTAGRMSTGI